MKQVKIDIISSFLQGVNTETMKSHAYGKYLKSGRYHILRYEEISLEDNSTIDVTIKYNEDEVIIFKSGDRSQELNFFRNKHSYGTFELGGFALKLDLVLFKFEVKDNDILLEYELYVDKQASGHFNINIKIGEEINE